MKLKVALHFNGAPKPDAVFEFERPDVPEGWRVTTLGGEMLKRRVKLSDGTEFEGWWILHQYRGRRKP